MELDPTRLLEAWPEPAWITTNDHTPFTSNHLWHNYAGWEPGAEGPPLWVDALHPDDWPAASSRWRSRSEAASGMEIRARLRRADGAYRHFLIKLAPLADAQGKVFGWWGSATDVEDAHQAQAAVAGRQRRLEQALDQVPAIMALYANTGGIVFSNRHMLDYHGQTLQQLQNAPAGIVYHPAERQLVLDTYRKALGTGTPFRTEARLRRAGGAYRWHQVRASPIFDAQGRVELWLGLSTDMEDVRHAEAQLAAETEVLNLVASRGRVRDVLETVCRQIEALYPGAVCGIVTVQPEEQTLRVAAGPRLPGRYRDHMDGAAISPGAGPCPLAASLKEPVITTDLGHDPRWPDSGWSDLVAAVGLRTCWSVPILSSGRETTGVLSVLRHEPATPSASQSENLTRFATIIGIAMEQEFGAGGRVGALGEA